MYRIPEIWRARAQRSVRGALIKKASEEKRDRWSMTMMKQLCPP